MESRIKEYLAISSESPTGLVWIKSPASSVPQGAFAFTNIVSGYYQGRLKGKYYKAHRIVFLLSHGFWPCGDIDHKDGNRLNNSPSNLRDVEKSINSQNQKKARGYWHDKRRGTYVVRIRLPKSKEQLYIGTFSDPDVATKAYLEAKLKLHPGYIPPKEVSHEL